MADEELPDQVADGETPKKKSKLGLLIGLVLAVALGGGGFFAVYSGMLLGSGAETAEAGHSEEMVIDELSPVSLVPLDPLVISMGRG